MGSPGNKDHSILESVLGPPIFGNSHSDAKRRNRGSGPDSETYPGLRVSVYAQRKDMYI